MLEVHKFPETVSEDEIFSALSAYGKIDNFTIVKKNSRSKWVFRWVLFLTMASPSVVDLETGPLRSPRRFAGARAVCFTL